MKAYMAYERHDGPNEGAVLVFANTAKEAKKLGAPVVQDWTLCDYIDVAVRLLPQDCAHMRLQEGPHVVDNPPTCKGCERWRSQPLSYSGYCEDCAECGSNGYQKTTPTKDAKNVEAQR